MMPKTRIEWCDYTINPVKGLCPMACSYCYARRMYKRFGWNPEIRYIGRTELFNQVLSIPRDKPARIFFGSTFELFGNWVEQYWVNDIFEVVSAFPFFTFIFLTKQPQNLPREFPDNCWIGLSVSHEGWGEKNYGCAGAIPILEDIQAKVKFISFEPLLSPMHTSFIDFCDWVIVGQQTPSNKKTEPKIEWIREIVEAADKAGIPVFLKFNLVGHIPIEEPFYRHSVDGWAIRQEFPNG